MREYISKSGITISKSIADTSTNNSVTCYLDTQNLLAELTENTCVSLLQGVCAAVVAYLTHMSLKCQKSNALLWPGYVCSPKVIWRNSSPSVIVLGGEVFGR